MEFFEEEIAAALKLTALAPEQVGVTHGRFAGHPVTVLISLENPQDPQPMAVLLNRNMGDLLQMQGYTFTPEGD